MSSQALCKSMPHLQMPSCFPRKRLQISWQPSGIEFSRSSTSRSTCNQVVLPSKAIWLRCQESGRAWARSWSGTQDPLRASLGKLFLIACWNTRVSNLSRKSKIVGMSYMRFWKPVGDQACPNSFLRQALLAQHSDVPWLENCLLPR